MANQPVNIRQRGVQSRQLIEIRDRLNNGEVITHVLNIKVSDEPSNRTHAASLRNLLKREIWEIPLNQIVDFFGQQIPAVVTWTMPGVTNCSAYYFTATYLNDLALARHTREALATICTRIRQQHPEFGNDWGIAYLITRPLDFLNQQMLHGQFDGNLAAPPIQGDGGEVEDDDEEEEWIMWTFAIQNGFFLHTF